MALAVLCQQMNKNFPNSAVKLRAFIVDHGARHGSDHEATLVSQYLQRIGMISFATSGCEQIQV